MRRVVLLAAALCAIGLVGTERAQAVELRWSGTCPGMMTIEWSGATPNRQAGLLWARDPGSTMIQVGRCAGTQLGLGANQLVLIRQFSTGASGSGGWTLTCCGAPVCGAYLQIVVADDRPCTTSNVVQIP